MPRRPLAVVGTGNSDTVPPVVISPMLFAFFSVNHSAAGPRSDGPTVILTGFAPGVKVLNVVTTPDVVICPMRLRLGSVNQRFPSGPATISAGRLLGPSLYSL